MCAGLRDAANLSWKLVAVLNGQAKDTLLDTYEIERRPHVKSIIELALMMGRTVCILDKDAAAERDAGMLAQRSAAGPDVAGEGFKFPPLSGPGIYSSPAAGELFIQPWSGGRRWDDVAGDGPWLITTEAIEHVEGLRVFHLAEPALSAFSGTLRQWLSKQGAAAVLVRPDRYVFGTGDPRKLIPAWSGALN